MQSITTGSRTALLQAEEILKQAQEQDVQVLFYTSEKYPDRLKQLPDAPILLYFKGNGNLNTRREDFTAEELKVMEVLLQSREEHMDNLSWKAQLPVSLLASELLGLEFKGVIEAEPGKKFALIS